MANKALQKFSKKLKEHGERLSIPDSVLRLEAARKLSDISRETKGQPPEALLCRALLQAGSVAPWEGSRSLECCWHLLQLALDKVYGIEEVLNAFVVHFTAEKAAGRDLTGRGPLVRRILRCLMAELCEEKVGFLSCMLSPTALDLYPSPCKLLCCLSFRVFFLMQKKRLSAEECSALAQTFIQRAVLLETSWVSDFSEEILLFLEEEEEGDGKETANFAPLLALFWTVVEAQQVKPSALLSTPLTSLVNFVCASGPGGSPGTRSALTLVAACTAASVPLFLPGEGEGSAVRRVVGGADGLLSLVEIRLLGKGNGPAGADEKAVLCLWVLAVCASLLGKAVLQGERSGQVLPLLRRCNRLLCLVGQLMNAEGGALASLLEGKAISGDGNADAGGRLLEFLEFFRELSATAAGHLVFTFDGDRAEAKELLIFLDSLCQAVLFLFSPSSLEGEHREKEKEKDHLAVERVGGVEPAAAASASGDPVTFLCAPLLGPLLWFREALQHPSLSASVPIQQKEKLEQNKEKEGAQAEKSTATAVAGGAGTGTGTGPLDGLLHLLRAAFATVGRRVDPRGSGGASVWTLAEGAVKALGDSLKGVEGLSGSAESISKGVAGCWRSEWQPLLFLCQCTRRWAQDFPRSLSQWALLFPSKPLWAVGQSALAMALCSPKGDVRARALMCAHQAVCSCPALSLRLLPSLLFLAGERQRLGVRVVAAGEIALAASVVAAGARSKPVVAAMFRGLQALTATAEADGLSLLPPPFLRAAVLHASTKAHCSGGLPLSRLRTLGLQILTDPNSLQARPAAPAQGPSVSSAVPATAQHGQASAGNPVIFALQALRDACRAAPAEVAGDEEMMGALQKVWNGKDRRASALAVDCLCLLCSHDCMEWKPVCEQMLRKPLVASMLGALSEEGKGQELMENGGTELMQAVARFLGRFLCLSVAPSVKTRRDERCASGGETAAAEPAVPLRSLDLMNATELRAAALLGRLLLQTPDGVTSFICGLSLAEFASLVPFIVPSVTQGEFLTATEEKGKGRAKKWEEEEKAGVEEMWWAKENAAPVLLVQLLETPADSHGSWRVRGLSEMIAVIARREREDLGRRKLAAEDTQHPFIPAVVKALSVKEGTASALPSPLVALARLAVGTLRPQAMTSPAAFAAAVVGLLVECRFGTPLVRLFFVPLVVGFFRRLLARLREETGGRAGLESEVLAATAASVEAALLDPQMGQNRDAQFACLAGLAGLASVSPSLGPFVVQAAEKLESREVGRGQEVSNDSLCSTLIALASVHSVSKVPGFLDKCLEKRQGGEDMETGGQFGSGSLEQFRLLCLSAEVEANWSVTGERVLTELNQRFFADREGGKASKRWGVAGGLARSVAILGRVNPSQETMGRLRGLAGRCEENLRLKIEGKGTLSEDGDCEWEELVVLAAAIPALFCAESVSLPRVASVLSLAASVLETAPPPPESLTWAAVAAFLLAVAPAARRLATSGSEQEEGGDELCAAFERVGSCLEACVLDADVPSAARPVKFVCIATIAGIPGLLLPEVAGQWREAEGEGGGSSEGSGKGEEGGKGPAEGGAWVRRFGRDICSREGLNVLMGGLISGFGSGAVNMPRAGLTVGLSAQTEVSGLIAAGLVLKHMREGTRRAQLDALKRQTLLHSLLSFLLNCGKHRPVYSSSLMRTRLSEEQKEEGDEDETTKRLLQCRAGSRGPPMPLSAASLSFAVRSFQLPSPHTAAALEALSRVDPLPPLGLRSAVLPCLLAMEDEAVWTAGLRFAVAHGSRDPALAEVLPDMAGRVWTRGVRGRWRSRGLLIRHLPRLLHLLPPRTATDALLFGAQSLPPFSQDALQWASFLEALTAAVPFEEGKEKEKGKEGAAHKEAVAVVERSVIPVAVTLLRRLHLEEQSILGNEGGGLETGGERERENPASPRSPRVRKRQSAGGVSAVSVVDQGPVASSFLVHVSAARLFCRLGGVWKSLSSSSKETLSTALTEGSPYVAALSFLALRAERGGELKGDPAPWGAAVAHAGGGEETVRAAVRSFRDRALVAPAASPREASGNGGGGRERLKAEFSPSFLLTLTALSLSAAEIGSSDQVRVLHTLALARPSRVGGGGGNFKSAGQRHSDMGTSAVRLLALLVSLCLHWLGLSSFLPAFQQSTHNSAWVSAHTHTGGVGEGEENPPEEFCEASAEKAEQPPGFSSVSLTQRPFPPHPAWTFFLSCAFDAGGSSSSQQLAGLLHGKPGPASQGTPTPAALPLGVAHTSEELGSFPAVFTDYPSAAPPSLVCPPLPALSSEAFLSNSRMRSEREKGGGGHREVDAGGDIPVFACHHLSGDDEAFVFEEHVRKTEVSLGVAPAVQASAVLPGGGAPGGHQDPPGGRDSEEARGRRAKEDVCARRMPPVFLAALAAEGFPEAAMAVDGGYERGAQWAGSVEGLEFSAWLLWVHGYVIRALKQKLKREQYAGGPASVGGGGAHPAAGPSGSRRVSEKNVGAMAESRSGDTDFGPDAALWVQVDEAVAEGVSELSRLLARPGG
uniref:Uncharacterized protein n=1 Tax=Chromera velia CCMP2878 TaxID=1169474 RepID=A0A0G4IB31_9ALVE|eukprot:Cvel_12716.t1-p1 / transcript=Cvel_12716.t1 / gene=Cvel_12716 / organism=Chromera_velia_CCMP2878 / gene_product=hypothetical protein / transcript_product=hypothetical protein / location=Cvel_scaffold843:45380-56787(+) / protein_length=2522 / sequence_SO=supercontig / SO=protein_coding / is_pseudo=false